MKKCYKIVDPATSLNCSRKVRRYIGEEFSRARRIPLMIENSRVDFTFFISLFKKNRGTALCDTRTLLFFVSIIVGSFPSN